MMNLTGRLLLEKLFVSAYVGFVGFILGALMYAAIEELSLGEVGYAPMVISVITWFVYMVVPTPLCNGREDTLYGLFFNVKKRK